ncbi:hypothetical protein B0H17DRAFT_1207688 [Mycena rosella]|uniref:Uncharacterized protein n=1 Tax=Mycena rosella TaxID=1033263 RepID=A0AAD7G7V3_MYCRO|nr:hypothetical protein B0H17DRAFT_1207688 [Mycena rosella]
MSSSQFHMGYPYQQPPYQQPYQPFQPHAGLHQRQTADPSTAPPSAAPLSPAPFAVIDPRLMTSGSAKSAPPRAIIPITSALRPNAINPAIDPQSPQPDQEKQGLDDNDVEHEDQARDSSPDSPDESRPSSPPAASGSAAKSTGPRVSATNVRHGYVDGAMRDKQDAKIFRRKALPSESNDPVRRFNKLLPDIISRCERLGAETGCWLVLTATNRAQGSGVLHYMTPPMRKDGLPQALTMLNTFKSTTAALKLARRQQAFVISQSYVALQREKEEADSAHEQARVDLAASQSTIALQAELIERLRGNCGPDSEGVDVDTSNRDLVLADPSIMLTPPV